MSFDFSDARVQTSQYDIDPGQYVMKVIAAQVKATKTGSGQYVELKWEVTGGPFEGKKITSRTNIVNNNEQAQSIGRDEMKTILLSLGMPPKFDSVTELVGKHAMVKVGKEKGMNDEVRPAVKGYSSIDGKPLVQPQANTTTQASTGGF